ncbi:MAG: ComF family protein [Oscillospiraceae bacterium]|nr:ComF family protein [Oscillospiraceae bacterium]
MGILNSSLNILFTPKCVFCRKPLRDDKTGVCPACSGSLPRTFDGGHMKTEQISDCVAPFYYEGVVRDSLLRYKFKNCTGYSKTYGAFLAECIRENLYGKYDFISWVPLSGRDYKERGYDQAMLLAMATALELDDVAVATLEKPHNVARQSSLNSAEKRRENIHGAYTVPDEELVRGKRILLIDDIVTTGSTLSECARMLRRAGAEDVLCAAVARAKE